MHRNGFSSLNLFGCRCRCRTLIRAARTHTLVFDVVHRLWRPTQIRACAFFHFYFTAFRVSPVSSICATTFRSFVPVADVVVVVIMVRHAIQRALLTFFSFSVFPDFFFSSACSHGIRAERRVHTTRVYTTLCT